MLLRRSIILIAIFSTLGIAGIYYLLNNTLDASYWEGMKLSRTVAKQEYCEFNNMNAFFRQNINSYSNLAYFFFGMIALLCGISDHRKNNSRNITTQFPAMSMLFGLSQVYLCFGSTFFHASLTWPGQRLDMNGTYSVAISLLLLALYRRVYSQHNAVTLQKIFVAAYFILVLFFVYLHLVIRSEFLLPGMILAVAAISVVNILRYGSFKISYGVISIACVIAAFIFRQTDVAKIGCDPYSIWQGHAAWHVLIGAGPFFLYLFYRSENAHS